MKPKIIFLPHGNLQYSQLEPSKRAWVIEQCYEKLFDLVARKGYKIGFEASGFTVDAIATLCPKVMDKLAALVKSGQIEPVGSPYIHIMLGNIDPAIGLETLKKGRQAWETHTGYAPNTGWNPECSWTDYIPDIFLKAGFESLVMDGDSFFLSFDEIRKAAGLEFDVAGHSNKNKLFKIEEFIQDKPEFLQFITNPSVAPNGLKMIFRSDMMANPMLWYLMGATEGVRNEPVQLDEINTIFHNWKSRIERSGSFIMPFAEDAEYIGSSAYFYVKQFNQARFFEAEPDSVHRFEEMLDSAIAMGYELATPSEAISSAKKIIPTDKVLEVENGIAWHGGTAKAWANTEQARILDPTCRMVFEGIKALAEAVGTPIERIDGELRFALERLTGAYVSDSRWPPAPTSPGRFNVQETLDDLYAANDLIAAAMKSLGMEHRKSIYSPSLMKTQIASVEKQMMQMKYFGE
ncbi:MAG: glycoside hydrolase family 57 [Planctomycetes bacterium GWF2_42_9]|nr:MAG: glycoside hydrolase family 57 [Planctomycetes bacterium GWF2_42_9]